MYVFLSCFKLQVEGMYFQKIKSHDLGKRMKRLASGLF